MTILEKSKATNSEKNKRIIRAFVAKKKISHEYTNENEYLYIRGNKK